MDDDELIASRLVLLTRAVAVFAVNAALGLAASGVSAEVGTQSAAQGAATAITFAWLLPMTAICALALAVNVIGITGIGLLTSLFTGGLLAWTLPMGYMAFAQYALLEFWRSPWTWPVRPPADRGAWICACVVFAIGLLAFTVRGARNRITDTA
jgi:hypothetical protein